MSDDKPSPLKDALKGFGLLFRAAKNVATRLPTKGVEDAMLTSAREVGRAIENVATRIDREVFGQAVFGQKERTGPPKDASQRADAQSATATQEPKPEAPKPPDAA